MEIRRSRVKVIMPGQTTRMQIAGRKAVDAHASVQRLAKTLARDLDDLPSGGIPIAEMPEDDGSLPATLEGAIAAKDETVSNVLVARTRSKDL